MGREEAFGCACEGRDRSCDLFPACLLQLICNARDYLRSFGSFVLLNCGD
jgi:hypothetical protein